MDSNGDNVEEDVGESAAGLENQPVNTTLEYSVCDADGSVACKLCGEFLPSRMHFYRHKYRYGVQTIDYR
jgi:hypothetical protein